MQNRCVFLYFTSFPAGPLRLFCFAWMSKNSGGFFLRCLVFDLGESMKSTPSYCVLFTKEYVATGLIRVWTSVWTLVDLNLLFVMVRFHSIHRCRIFNPCLIIEFLQFLQDQRLESVEFLQMRIFWTRCARPKDLGWVAKAGMDTRCYVNVRL